MSVFQSLFPAHREAEAPVLPSEGHLPPFEGATGWLNSEPHDYPEPGYQEDFPVLDESGNLLGMITREEIFPAWEVPDVFATEVRAAFRSMR